MKCSSRRIACVLLITGASGLGFVASAPLAAPASTANAEPMLDYTVEPGDTLIGIRDRLLVPGTGWKVLQRINRVQDPRRLRPGSTLRLPLSLMREQDSQARLSGVVGPVTVLRRGAATPQPLASGDVLQPGDRVNTGARASAVIAFEDGTRVLLRPDSQLLVERITRVQPAGPGRTELQLESGSADTQVPVPEGKTPRSRVRLRTPVVNLGVRGTDFRTQASAARAQVEVLQGRVGAAAGAAAAVNVDGGFGAVATERGVGAPRALLPAPDLSGTATLLERLPLKFVWPNQAGAAAYRAQVHAADGSLLLLDGLVTAPQVQWPDLPDGSYELRVRAADSLGLEGRDARSSFRLKARPEPPFTVEPRAGVQTAEDPVRFRWSRSASAERYVLQVSDTPGFETLREERQDVDDTEVQIELPLGTHHWRVASVRGLKEGADQDRGPWSDVQAFTRVPPPPPPPPPPPGPPGQAVPQSTSDGVLMSWPQVPLPGARYNVQVSRDPGFQTLLADEVTAQPQWLLRSPEPGLYHVRVRTIGVNQQPGPFGATQQLEVPRSALWWLLLPAVLLLLL